MTSSAISKSQHHLNLLGIPGFQRSHLSSEKNSNNVFSLHFVTGLFFQFLAHCVLQQLMKQQQLTAAGMIANVMFLKT